MAKRHLRRGGFILTILFPRLRGLRIIHEGIVLGGHTACLSADTGECMFTLLDRADGFTQDALIACALDGLRFRIGFDDEIGVFAVVEPSSFDLVSQLASLLSKL